MRTSPRCAHHGQAGRALPLVLVLVALAALAWLLLGDPFGLGGGDAGDGAGAGGAPDLLGAEGADEGAAPRTDESVGTLTGRYGEGDRGALRLRLLWVSTREPLVGQPARLLDRRGAEVASVPSDARGVVLFAEVHPGKGYRLAIEGEGFSTVLMQGVSVHPQATTDLGDLVLGKDVVLRGRVVDGGGRPVPGTTVSVHTIERHLATKGLLVYFTEAAQTLRPPLSEVTSDEEGYFAFSALEDGQYSVVARHGGYATHNADDVIVARQRGARPITLVLGRSARARGVVRDPDGKPVAGAQVMAVLENRRMSSNPMQREVTTTAADGSYLIDTLGVDRRYRFGVLAEGYAPVFEVGATTIGPDDIVRDFTLVEGGKLQGVVTDEGTGKPVEGARVTVYVGPMPWGRQRPDPDAKAAADIRRTDAQGRFLFEALSPGQVSSAVVQARGYVSRSFMRFPPPGEPWPDVVAGETTEVTVALQRGGTIRGVVQARGAGTPIQGAEITVLPTGMMMFLSMATGTPTAVSGADGAYVLEGVRPGTYRLMAYADGFSPAGGEEGVEVQVPPSGGTIERSLELISAGVVEGVVEDLAGEPVAGVQIRLRAGPESGGGGARRGGMRRLRSMMLGGANPVDLTSDDGRFRLEGVASDTMWVVYGESDEYVSGESKPFKIAAGETRQVKLQMLPGGAIRGVVFGESGRRLAGVRVQVGLLPDDLAAKPTLNAWEARRVLGSKVYTTDEEGRFFAPNLKPGKTLVRASKDGYITFYKRNATVRPGETIENYQVPLSRGETVEGVVLGADGRPLSDAMVAVTSQRQPRRMGQEGEAGADGGEVSEDVEPMMFSRTDREGRYQVFNVKPGTYSVVVWFAQGHKGWSRDGSEAAIHRDVRVPGDVPAFRLEAADPGEGGGLPRGPRGGGGR